MRKYRPCWPKNLDGIRNRHLYVFSRRYPTNVPADESASIKTEALVLDLNNLAFVMSRQRDAVDLPRRHILNLDLRKHEPGQESCD